MLIIAFYTSDGVIWNKDQLIVDIMHRISLNDQSITISTMGEGPCAKSLGLYDLLDQICAKTGFAKEKIFIRTSNLVESHDQYSIVIDPTFTYLDTARTLDLLDHAKNIQDDFKHFGHFVGHGNFPRLFLASYLHKYQKEKSLQTYHWTAGDTYHRPFSAVEDMIFYQKDWQKVNDCVDLLKASPLLQDSIESYPILQPTTFNITKLYNRFFVEICSLTYYSGDTFYIDEKIWRPMLMRTPVIVQGPRFFLKRLKDLGFQTFDYWWNEGYNEDHLEDQLKGITDICNRLCSLSTEELDKIYKEMTTVLNHNFERMMSLTADELDILRAK